MQVEAFCSAVMDSLVEAEKNKAIGEWFRRLYMARLVRVTSTLLFHYASNKGCWSALVTSTNT